MEEATQTNGIKKNVCASVLVSVKTDFKTKKRTRDRWTFYEKGTIRLEEITFINIYAPNVKAPKYIIQILTYLKIETDNNTVIDFNTPRIPMDRASTQKVSKKALALNDTLGRMDLTGILRTFHPKVTKCTFFSSAYGTFSKTDHMLGDKTNINSFRRLK